MRKRNSCLRFSLAMASVTFCLFAQATVASAQAAELEAPQLEPGTHYHLDVYDDLAVEATELGEGEFLAQILVADVPRATYQLSVAKQAGRWRILPEDPTSSEAFLSETRFDYRLALVRGHEGSIQSLLERNNATSVAFSAILLWEDYEAGQTPCKNSAASRVLFNGQTRRYVQTGRYPGD